MKRIITLIAFIVCLQEAQAQYTRFIIQFTDKKGTAHSLANPATFLSNRAIDRRTRQHITLDSTDLPVSAAYMDSIRKVPNVTILNISRWLNQVLIQTSDNAALAKISSYPFVRSSAPISKRTALTAIERASRFIETETPLASFSTNREYGANVLNYGNNFAQLHIHQGEFLHNHGFTGRGVVIAILDGGFRSYDTNNAFDSVRQQNRVLGTWDFVANEASVAEDDSHGANCFSIIAANKPGQIVGSAPYASFWLFRTENTASEYPIEEQNWAAGAEYADSVGADMISSSLGYSDFDDASFNHSYAERDGNTAISTRAADYAARKGIIVMNSLGNSGNLTTDFKYVSCPADGDSVVGVGATNSAGVIASFSSWGPNGAGKLKPNIVSVGQGTVFANTVGNVSSGNGTSYSNPNIAGLIACFWQAFPELTNMQLIDAVQKSADRYENPDYRYGYGLPDFKKATVSLLKQQASTSVSFANCVATLQWSSKDDTSVVYTIQRRLPGETSFTLFRQVSSSSLSFQSNNYKLMDTLSGVANGLAEYNIVQTIGTDTSFTLASVQQEISPLCFPDNAVRVLPNPFINQLLIVVNTPEAINPLGIEISDMLGRIVYKQVVNKPAGYLSIPVYTNGWQDGVYAIKLLNGNKRFYQQKLLKRP